MTELHLCNTCRLNQGFKRNTLKSNVNSLSYCTECKKPTPILSNKYFKKISAPLKNDLREDLSTLRNVIKDLKSENEKLKNPWVSVDITPPKSMAGVECDVFVAWNLGRLEVLHYVHSSKKWTQHGCDRQKPTHYKTQAGPVNQGGMK